MGNGAWCFSPRASYESLETPTLIPAPSGGLSVCSGVSGVEISSRKSALGIEKRPDGAAVRRRNTRECCIAVFDLGSDQPAHSDHCTGL